ncbi:MAG: DoxX family protein [Nocardia sp.]|uniref:DoxX family protein n=1 Tax=Nocardia sp. TaxID=1821 RepID=UPI0026336482|nr:DoxX family protein [Nocardia sp.]MCU1641355.1 DoxX family protein [Nocardia sp.]
MNILLWIVAAALASVFLAAGSMKLVTPPEKLRAKGMEWVEQVPTVWIRALGAIEVLGAIGLIFPAMLQIAPVLVPLAAVGVVLVMTGAAIVHVYERNWPGTAVTIVLLAAGVFLAWGRFGPYSFTS